jgi:hypothetical protein
MITTRLDRRALGAIEFIDAMTGATITRAMQVQTVQSEAKIYRQRSGLWVIADAPGLHDYTLEFSQAPAMPAVGSLPITVTVIDPGREYQSTTVEVPLPRDPDPAAANSVLKPHQVKLWRTAAAALSPSWTVYQATLVMAGTETPVEGALLSLVAGGHTVHALSDMTGQATLALVGQSLFSLDSNAKLTRTLAAQVSVRRDVPAARLPNVEAEIARLMGKSVLASFSRSLLTGASTSEVLEINP